MIDMTAYILKKFDADALEAYVFRGVGGDSRVAPKAFLQAGTVVAAYNATDAPRCIQNYGPGLVSAFKVHEEGLSRSKRPLSQRPTM